MIGSVKLAHIAIDIDYLQSAISMNNIVYLKTWKPLLNFNFMLAYSGVIWDLARVQQPPHPAALPTKCIHQK